MRPFADLRDGTHGGARSRPDKERLFAAAVQLLDPHARQALEEIDTNLLLGVGEVTATGVRSSADDGSDAVWALSWPEQQAAGVEPIGKGSRASGRPAGQRCCSPSVRTDDCPGDKDARPGELACATMAQHDARALPTPKLRRSITRFPSISRR